MASKQVALQVKMEQIFSDSLLPLLSPMAKSVEGKEALKLLIVSEAIDLVKSKGEINIVDYDYRYGAFAAYFTEDVHDTLKGFIYMLGVNISKQAAVLNLLKPASTLYYVKALNFDVVVIGIEEYDINILRNQLNSFVN